MHLLDAMAKGKEGQREIYSYATEKAKVSSCQLSLKGRQVIEGFGPSLTSPRLDGSRDAIEGSHSFITSGQTVAVTAQLSQNYSSSASVTRRCYICNCFLRKYILHCVQLVLIIIHFNSLYNLNNKRYRASAVVSLTNRIRIDY